MVPLRVAASLRFVAALVALMALAWAGSPALAAEPVLDHSVDACDDFFHFACNAWIKDHPIPEDQSRWTAFDELNIHTRDSLHDLLEEAVAHPTGDSAKPGAYYAACMDEAGIEARGLKPLQGELDRIAALSDKTALPVLVAALQRNGSDVLFDFDSGIDDSDPVHDIAVLGQGGLGLPDRDQYVKTDPKSVELRAKYRAHVARMLVLSGMDEAGSGAAADAVIAFETSLAQHALTRVQRRDPKAVFHKLPVAALTSAAPDFAWDRYFTAIGVPAFKLLNIREPDFVDNLGKLLDATPLETIRTYLRWQVLHRSAPFLPSAFVDENFAFYGKILQGKQVIEPRWRRCVVATDAALGEALGKLYVEHYFPPTNRALVRHLIGDVRAAFRRDIDTLPWMGAVTRKRALEKLDAMVEKIAYPDKWRDYSALQISPDDALANDFRANQFELHRRLMKIGGAADPAEWHMTPPTVNAYYSPKENNINFPAGILQLPFFDPARDEAENLGGLGAVAGHEMTHGFDDSGRQFGPHGALDDWWSPEDAAKFKARAQCIVDEYSGMTAVEDVHVNGELTLGENTADNGGLRLALSVLEAHHLGDREVEGLNGRQRFFIAFAQLWCGAIRPEAARLRVQTDPHSPAAARVNGTVSNMPEFAAAFRCKPGQAMVRETPCRVW